MENSPEVWKTVKELFQAAQEIAPEDVSAFLDHNCHDAAIQAEVKKLLTHHFKAGNFLETPAWDPVRIREQFRSGDVLASRFKIIRFIAAGGMGEVYEAEDVELKDRRAIKLIRHDLLNPGVIARFRHEVRLAQRVTHLNVCRIFDIFRHKSEVTGINDLWVVSMELLRGETLADRLREKGRMSLSEALPLIDQMCSALRAAHHAGIVHRDFKPSNVMLVASDRRGDRAVVTDFGLAVQSATEETTSPVTGNQVFGSLPYMAPEQIEDHVATSASDIYALGLVIYEMVTGKQPVNGETPLSIAVQRLTQPPISPRIHRPDLPGNWETAILRCLERDPTKRFGNVEEVANALSGEGGPTLGSPTPDLRGLKRDAKSGHMTAPSLGTVPNAHAGPDAQNRSLRKIAASFALRLTRFRPVAQIVLSVALTTSLIGGGLYYYLFRVNPPTEKDTFVLADFENNTDNPVFDDTLRTALSISLEQSPFLNMLSNDDVTTAQSMTSPEAASDVCLQAGGTAYVAGSVASMGNKYVVALKAVNCQKGDTLAEDRVTATSKDKVLHALDEAASKLRRELGESPWSVWKSNVPIEATTGSLEALQYYSMGIGIEDERGIPLFRQAIGLDPNFPLAYAEMAVLYGNLGQRSLGLEFATKAYQLRDRLNAREKSRISAIFFRALGSKYADMGFYDKAIEQYQEALRFAPDDVVNYRDMGATCVNMNRLDDANAEYALVHTQDSGFLRVNLYYLAFLRGEDREMRQLANSALGNYDEDLLLSLESDTAAYYGRMSEARDFSRRAVESAVLNGGKGRAALWQVNAALREAELSNAAFAKKGAMAALNLSWDRSVEMVAALTLARAGDARTAELLTEDLEKAYPTDALLEHYWLPTIKAAIALSQGNSSQAIMDLKAVVPPYDLGQAGMLINYLYPAYLRGQAYLLAQNGVEAAAEFQKLNDHSGIMKNFVTGTVAHLLIARAHAMAGKTEAANAAYEDFFTIWKHASPDIPILKEARETYSVWARPLHVPNAMVGFNKPTNAGPGTVIKTRTVFSGQTMDQVVAILGQPKTIADVSPKIIYVYPDVKVTFFDGKVKDVQ